VEALAKPQDVVIGISTSGKSPNVLKGVEQANQMGVVSIGMTGATGGLMKGLCTLCLCVPSTTTCRIQEMHITLGHILCAAVEEILYFQS
jgi:D-sedoheptulose 7-phosphate isomerase